MKSPGLKAGDWVEVRSRREILATLDAKGCLDGLPFMPEMLEYCGRRLRVFKRAHKTCDTVDKTGGRSMPAAVHLDGVRCSGAAHGGCQAGCLIFWKESWLKRAPTSGSPGSDVAAPASGTDAAVIEAGAYLTGRGGPEAQIRYRCQATELGRATSLLPWWDLRQYLEDLLSGNIGPGALIRGVAFSAFRRLTEIGIGHRVLVRLYDLWARVVGISSFPLRQGVLKKTPAAELGLEPGEWVRVKPYEEIVKTLDANNRNRGLFFDVEATKFCGKTFRVLRRVTRILDERSGEMRHLTNPCIILEQVYCGGEMSKYRLFCPRAIYPYWREIWLERVPAPDSIPR
jgi:hypothetical protein